MEEEREIRIPLKNVSGANMLQFLLPLVYNPVPRDPTLSEEPACAMIKFGICPIFWWLAVAEKHTSKSERSRAQSINVSIANSPLYFSLGGIWRRACSRLLLGLRYWRPSWWKKQIFIYLFIYLATARKEIKKKKWRDSPFTAPASPVIKIIWKLLSTEPLAGTTEDGFFFKGEFQCFSVKALFPKL